MKIVYASRTGNVESIINKLGVDALRIEDGSESVAEDYIIFTYTDGYGDIPGEVADFLENNSANVKGVVVSGDTAYGDAFCGAGDAIAEEYNVPVLYKVENDGTDEDIENAKTLVDASVGSISESQDSEITYYFSQELSDEFVSTEDYINRINNVSKEQIVEVANKIQINTIYFLKD